MAEYKDWLANMGISDKVYAGYTPSEQIGLGQSYANLLQPTTQPGLMDKTMNFLGSKTMEGLGTIGGLGLGVFNAFEARDAKKDAKKMWEAENARANELMAINKEKYDTFKADKARLNSQYV